MSEQPNISQILAALAAQRPGGTPAQGQLPPQQQQQQQQPVPQPYHAPYQNSVPPPGPTPYPLPQPTSSGNVDLSNIRPTNSGSVSLADAIARARGIAAEKGVSYDVSRAAPIRDGDPRLTGRPFRHSRSRSRSPQRVARDNFRDNYNPYRDERRDERRDDSRRTNGPSFNRDRSFSPVIAARGGLPPFPQRGGFLGPGDRSPAYGGGPGGGGGGEEEYILIDSNLVGLIIGRQGENLRRVENETHTRVQFITGPDATGPKRQCKIRGTPQAREDAKAEITRIIEENGNPARGNVPPERLSANTKPIGGHQPALRSGEDAEQIMVPNRTVGLIIGRGGETIRDLQERSQCHVNIVGPEKSINGLRPVNLIGTPQAAAMAKDLIMEIVDSDTKSLAAQGGSQGPPQDSGPQSGGPGYGGFGGGGSDSYGDKINDTLMVPSESVGMIIGKGGETIKDMQNNTGCKINVAQPSGQDYEREIGLVGTRSAIELAKRTIMEKVHAVEEKNRPGAGAGRRDDPYQDRFSDQPPQRPPPGGYNGPPPQANAAPQEGPADPYAAYGGEANYQALWAHYYQSLATQGHALPGQGPPGPA